MSTELETRLRAVETALEEIKTLKGIRGPAGDIAAAVGNAERVAREVVADAKKAFEPAVQAMNEALKEIQQANSDGLTTADDKIRNAVAQFRELFDERFNNLEHEIAAHVLPLLHEYGLLKNGSPSADYFRGEFEPRKKL
jgi:ABC-type transporter Mla subunit MlaD